MSSRILVNEDEKRGGGAVRIRVEGGRARRGWVAALPAFSPPVPHGGVRLGFRGWGCKSTVRVIHARGVGCNRPRIYVEFDVSDFMIQGDSALNRPEVDVSRPLAWDGFRVQGSGVRGQGSEFRV